MINLQARQFLGIALLLLVPACTPHAAHEARAPRPSPTAITLAQIETANQVDAYALVQALRPHWLRTRGSTSIVTHEQVQVYQDGTRIGGPGALRQISTRSIHAIQYYDGRSATQKWGTQHGNGAILVLTRRW